MVSARAFGHTNHRKKLSFHHLHTGETLKVTYWADGAFIPDSLAEIDLLLRDFRTGEIKPIDRRLLHLLSELQTRLDTTQSFHVISGYRSSSTNKRLAKAGRGVAKRSLHIQAKAIDVRIPGRPLEQLQRAAMAMNKGGVGYYPKSDFVHLDVGRVRSW